MTLEERLLEKPGISHCVAVLAAARELPSASLVEHLCAEARRNMRVNLAMATSYAAAAWAVARCLKLPRPLAEALKMKGHVAYLAGRHASAAKAYCEAVSILERLGEDIEAARTLSSGMQTLMYLGRDEEALEWAARARAVFLQHGDQLRLARLDINTANVLQRQDRPAEALPRYEAALAAFREHGDRESTAIALRNLAVCRMDVNDFEGALAAYREARGHSDALGLQLLTGEIEDNIAYLHYLTGDFAEALALYRARRPDVQGNSHAAAISLLDQSALYLELNLHAEAAEAALGAATRFRALRMRFERAKALMNFGVALAGSGYRTESLRTLKRARTAFQKEGNAIQAAIASLHSAEILRDSGELCRAKTVAAESLALLETSQLDSRKAAAALLMADIELMQGDLDGARAACQKARSWSAGGIQYALRVQMTTTEARIHEAAGERPQALEKYREAHALIESARGRLMFDQLRSSFLATREGVYQGLIRLALEDGDADTALRYVEQSKSRSLADSLLHRPGAQAETPEIQALRRELHWLHHRFDRLAANRSTPALARMEELKEKMRACERKLVHALTAALPVTAGANWEPLADDFTMRGLQSELPDETTLLEYFESGGDLYVAVISPEHASVTRLGHFSATLPSLRFLGLQLSRGLSGPFRPAADDPDWLAATRSHLTSLYQHLIAPVEQRLRGRHLVVVPHRGLHNVPFHALYNGEEYLMDGWTVSIAPSALIYRLCRGKRSTAPGRALVLGVPDAAAPHIATEAEDIANLLSPSILLTGCDATLGRFTDLCRDAAAIHIASHGEFRRDNPAFSAIRLSDERLCLYDLYRLRMDADLVTLSGCATGFHQAAAGDESMGLVRGFLAAGAKAVHASLWDVDDKTTSMYMTAFYKALQSQCVHAAARSAVVQLRSEYPHPFFWAPFYVTGRTNELLPVFSRPRRVPCVQETS